MKIRITKCSKTSYWYSELIGNVFDVRISTAFQDKYSIKQTPSRMIDISDTEVLNGETVKRRELIDFIAWFLRNSVKKYNPNKLAESIADEYIKSINE